MKRAIRLNGVSYAIKIENWLSEFEMNKYPNKLEFDD